MSERELRDLAEQYIDRQLKLAKATVTAEKRREMIENAVSLVHPQPETDLRTA